MILHFHYSLVPNSGDVKRISNIDREFSEYYSEQTIEVVFCPIRKLQYVRKDAFFKLSRNTKKKYCIPLIPRAKYLNYIYESIILSLLGLLYKPTFLIGEMLFPKYLSLIFRFLNPKTTIIADIHGAAVDENMYQNPNMPRNRLEEIRTLDRDTMQTANYIICQSDEMKKYIISNYGLNSDRIIVYRCGYDSNLFFINEEKRILIRNKLDINDEILFVYSGGLHKWQKIEESLRIFARYHNFNVKSKFLILTNDQLQLRHFLNTHEFETIKESVLSVSVSFSSVPEYLNACDVAFLIRDNHIMNAVASPTKLAEYMACGLPVISTEVSKCWVTENASDYIILSEKIENNDDIDKVINAGSKEKIESYAINNLSLKIDRQNLVQFFNTIK